MRGDRGAGGMRGDPVQEGEAGPGRGAESGARVSLRGWRSVPSQVPAPRVSAPSTSPGATPAWKSEARAAAGPGLQEAEHAQRGRATAPWAARLAPSRRQHRARATSLPSGLSNGTGRMGSPWGDGGRGRRRETGDGAPAFPSPPASHSK